MLKPREYLPSETASAFAWFPRHTAAESAKAARVANMEAGMAPSPLNERRSSSYSSSERFRSDRFQRCIWDASQEDPAELRAKSPGKDTQQLEHSGDDGNFRQKAFLIFPGAACRKR